MKKQAKMMGILLGVMITTGGAGYATMQIDSSAHAAEQPKRELAAPVLKQTQAIQESVPTVTNVEKQHTEKPAAPAAQPKNTETIPSNQPAVIQNNEQYTKPSTPPAETNVPAAPEKKAATPQPDESIIIDGSTFVPITDTEKFSVWINASKKYGAKLYGVKESDVFAIIKNKTPIVSLSVGYAAAAPQYTELLCDLFATEGDMASAIAEGIRTVARTGQPVKVGETPDGSGYSIYMNEEGRITVSW